MTENRERLFTCDADRRHWRELDDINDNWLKEAFLTLLMAWRQRDVYRRLHWAELDNLLAEQETETFLALSIAQHRLDCCYHDYWEMLFDRDVDDDGASRLSATFRACADERNKEPERDKSFSRSAAAREARQEGEAE